MLSGQHRVDVTNGSKFSFVAPAGPFWGVPQIISDDGKTVVAEVIVGELGETQIYKVNENGTWQALTNEGGSNASPYGMSANGNVVIGEILGGPGPYQNYRWLNGTLSSFGDYLTSVSGDGNVIFGDSWGIAVYWDQGVEYPIGEDGWDSPRIMDSSFNGQIAVGHYGLKGFHWRKGIGFTSLGSLPGTPGLVIPGSLSNDGSIIAGTETRGSEVQPWVFRNGMQTVSAFLNARGISTTDWTFTSVKVSNNGEAMVGIGQYKGEPRFFHTWLSGNHLTVHGLVNTTTAGKTVTGTVSFAAPSPTARVVSLSTSSPDLIVPATVTVPANAENVSFPIQVKPTAAAGKLTVNASIGELAAGFDVNVVEPIQSVTLSPNRIHGGKYTRCTVTFQHPLRALTQFVPKQVNGIVMPGAINAPAGASSISFNVVSPGLQVESLQTYAVKISSAFHTEKAATLQVYPPIGWMTVYPLQIKGGMAGLGRIGVGLAAPAMGLTYSLRSLSSLITVPASASIPEGATQTQFTVNTLPVTTMAVRSIEARTSYTTKTVNVTIVP